MGELSHYEFISTYGYLPHDGITRQCQELATYYNEFYDGLHSEQEYQKFLLDMDRLRPGFTQEPMRVASGTINTPIQFVAYSVLLWAHYRNPGAF